MDDGRAVRVHHALRPARGAGGVAHGHRVVLIVRHVVEFFRRAGEEILVARELLRHRLAAEGEHDHLLEVRLAADLLEERQQDVVDDEEAVLGVIRDPGDVVWREPQVERVHHAARRRDAEIALQVGVMVPAQRRHALALLQPRGEQRRGQLARAPVVLGECVPLERLVGQAADDLRFAVQPPGALQQVVQRQPVAHHGRAHGTSLLDG